MLTATSDLAAMVMNTRVGSQAYDEVRRRGLLPTPADVDLAQRALEWAREKFSSIPEDDRTDFEQSMYVATKSSVLSRRALGLCAYAVQAYLRHLGEEETRRQAAAESQYLGEVGKRVEFRATITDIKIFNGAFGTTRLYLMVTPEGHRLAWYASSVLYVAPSDPELTLEVPAEIGQTHEFCGKVKKQEVYRGVRQTTMSRCVVLGAEYLRKRAEKAEKAAKRAEKKSKKSTAVEATV